MSEFTANLIRTVNELQDRLNPLVSDNIAFDLPQIAVIGGQSSGKSSVLESFVGRDFLPRGTDIVTRRPLVLQLINNKIESKSYGKFLHIPGKIFYDFLEIRDEITNETDREVKGRGISSKPINLKIYSPDVLDLTLVDLPGMTRIPVKDQPKDIENIIQNMVLEYIEKENCLILAVTAANQDLATSDALKLAKSVDPEGKRTIGVLTKLDLMDKGTDARDILSGKHLPLRMGYIGVINRSQEDIKANTDMKTALAKEHKFFNEHQSYKDMSTTLGISYLQQYLHKKLSKHIFRLLPPLKQKFEKELFELHRKSSKLLFPNQLIDKEIIISECHQQFSKHVKTTLLGEGQDIDLSKLSGGAKINALMNKTFAKEVNKMVYNEKQLKNDISKAIQNSFGIYLELFIPNSAFKAVIRNQIETFKKPSLNCIESITREIEGIVEESADKLQRIPNLKEMFTKFTLECVRKCKAKCEESVLRFIKGEQTYLNTIHEDLLKLNSIENSKNKPEENVLLSTYCVIDYTTTNGWVRFKNNNFWFVLRNGALFWFSNQSKSDQKGSVDIKEAEFKYLPNKSKIVLILAENNEMELTFDSKDSVKQWKKWFEMSGVKPFFTKTTLESNPDSPHSSHKSSDLSTDSSEDESEFPEHLKPQVALMKTLVDSHYVIMKKKFKDQIPKICALELMDSMITFVEIELIPLIRQTIPSVDDIIGEDPFKEIREELNERKKLYSEAIEIIDKFSKQSQ